MLHEVTDVSMSYMVLLQERPEFQIRAVLLFVSYRVPPSRRPRLVINCASIDLAMAFCAKLGESRAFLRTKALDVGCFAGFSFATAISICSWAIVSLDITSLNVWELSSRMLPTTCLTVSLSTDAPFLTKAYSYFELA